MNEAELRKLVSDLWDLILTLEVNDLQAVTKIELRTRVNKAIWNSR